MKYVDLVLVKANVSCGRLRTKLDAFGNIFLEDTLSGEAVKIGTVPDGYTFKAASPVRKGRWILTVTYPYSSLNMCTKSEDGWECSECGYIVSEKHDWCPGCGTDMRAPVSKNTGLEELLSSL